MLTREKRKENLEMAKKVLLALGSLTVSVWIACCATMSDAVSAKDEGTVKVTKGTLNVVIGNRNGIVIATDSRATFGNDQHEDTHQKLFLIGDKIAVTIAGYGTGMAPKAPHFTVSASGIIQNYIDELARNKHVPSYSEVALALPQAICFGLTGISNVALYSGSSGRFALEMIVTGRVSNGFKITRVEIRSEARLTSEKKLFLESSVVDTKEYSVSGNQFVFVSAGLNDIARDIIRDPVRYQKFASSFTKLVNVGGETLSPKDLEALTKDLFRLTEEVYQGVGGPLQLVSYENDRFIQKSSLQSTVKSRPTTPFSMVRSLTVQEGEIFRATFPIFYMDVGFEHGQFNITNNLYINCVFTDAQVFLQSDLFFLGPSNSVRDSAFHGSALWWRRETWKKKKRANRNIAQE